jgi:hypothetical protein
MGQVVAVKAQEEAPGGLKDPATQRRQVTIEFAPGVVEKMPAAHGLQVVLKTAPTTVL